MLSESAIDNILMAQKDDIYSEFNDAVHSPDGIEVFNYFEVSMRRIDSILHLLQFNLRLWNEASYGYKGLEIVRRIEVALRNTLDTLHRAPAKSDRLKSAIATCRMLESAYVSLR